MAFGLIRSHLERLDVVQVLGRNRLELSLQVTAMCPRIEGLRSILLRYDRNIEATNVGGLRCHRSGLSQAL